MGLEQSLVATTELVDADRALLGQIRAERDRFVALAFCGADILLELDGDGTIEFAGRATKAFVGQHAS